MTGERKWFTWWFTRGIGSVITIPVVLFLILGCIYAFIQGGIQTFAYLRVLKAVAGFWGIIIFIFVWPFSLLIPGYIWWAAIREIPKVIQTEARTRGSAAGYFIVGLVFLVGIASGIQWGHGRAIGWIADKNPTAAFKAGVMTSAIQKGAIQSQLKPLQKQAMPSVNQTELPPLPAGFVWDQQPAQNTLPPLPEGFVWDSPATTTNDQQSQDTGRWPQLKIGGIAKSSSRNIVIINSKIVGVGDEVNGVTIIEIKDNCVKMKKGIETNEFPVGKQYY
jgi:hypothetical protein